MSNALPESYLSDITDELRKHWPKNRTINIVCHGHSVPSGYFATPMVDSLHAYPHQLYVMLKHRFPFAVINVIVTGIGGENSASGAARFNDEVLCHRPDVITIDYGLNDRGLGLDAAHDAWSQMIQETCDYGAKLLLLTPTPDKTQAPGYSGDDQSLLGTHAEQIRSLAETHGIGLVDSLSTCMAYAKSAELTDILSWSNHPNQKGHELVATELLRWFPAG